MDREQNSGKQRYLQANFDGAVIADDDDHRIGIHCKATKQKPKSIGLLDRAVTTFEDLFRAREVALSKRHASPEIQPSCLRCAKMVKGTETIQTRLQQLHTNYK